MGLFSWFKKREDAKPAGRSSSSSSGGSGGSGGGGSSGGAQGFARTDARPLGDDPMPGWQPAVIDEDDATGGAADAASASPPSAAATSSHPVEISCGDVAAQLDATRNKRIAFIDVRETWEFETRRIEGAHHVPLGTVTAHLDDLANLAMQHDLLVVYCEHGMRSLDATMLLRREGIDQARSMSGGMAAWAATIGRRMTSGSADPNDED